VAAGRGGVAAASSVNESSLGEVVDGDVDDVVDMAFGD
jgi:hypothetical protein